MINFILNEDKFRSKLLNLSIPKRSVSYEQAFPKRSKFEHFEYIGSGSYAQVYRHKIINQQCEDILQNDPLLMSNDSIIKFIEVFSEGIIENLFGVKTSSSVSNYKDAYNEFRISTSLSYLNIGIRYTNLGYQCPLFPYVYGCYLINHSMMPDYFEIPTTKTDKKSKCVFRFDYRKLMEPPLNGEKKDDDNNGDDDNNNNDDDDNDDDGNTMSAGRSKQPLSVVKRRIAPEVAAIKMEDCGQSLYDQMENYRPLEILSVAKQLLLGFTIAEKLFEFEHRDLHLGNILVKPSPYEQLIYVYDDQFLQMPSNNLLVKVIDTTFSRLKIKNRIHYRDLSHLFDAKDFEHRVDAENNNQLAHQNETYKAMASEVRTDWIGFYPRTNMFWLIYIIRKFGRIMRKQQNQQQRRFSSEWFQVRSILKCYIHSLFKMNNLQTFYRKVMIRPQFNLLVPIRRMAIDDTSDSNLNHHKNNSSLSRCHTISTTSTIGGNDVVEESNIVKIDPKLSRRRRQKSQSTTSPTISNQQATKKSKEKNSDSDLNSNEKKNNDK
ncbi:Serine/threonine-protein kinase haspin [Dermatophagoides pteronyssinus]|uniref:non-specific serine/threonine protein kinase n=1 Tax=Dermatophagoides pteronyssinus TaxID=6956 RepID=A0ABQ8J824_DERPT|nr:Serine/threonine-protein kinase haspin [Dermatophagoides pteronyssinus]